MNVKIINPLEYDQWDEMVLATEQYSVFYSKAWTKILSESYGYKPQFFMIGNGKGIAALIPFMEVDSRITGKRCVALPFSDYCEPIIKDSASSQELFEFIIRYGKSSDWESLDIHGGEVIFKDEKPSKLFYGHLLALDTEQDKLFQQFSSNTKRNIKKALKCGIEIIHSYSYRSLKEFYRLHCINRKRHQLPAQPFRFFEKIYEHIISKKSGLVIKARYRKKIVAAAVYFQFGEKAMYKFGASDYKYQHLRVNNLIMWDAIKWYANKGYDTFCFGRTNLDNDGLRRYKNGWGAKEYVINYFKYDLKMDALVESKNDKMNKIINSIFGSLPIDVSKLLGRLLYKHFG